MVLLASALLIEALSIGIRGAIGGVKNSSYSKTTPWLMLDLCFELSCLFFWGHIRKNLVWFQNTLCIPENKT